MAWQFGQLGRFTAEDPKKPRFEVVGINKEKRLVKVWYHLERKPTTIPADTFKRDCVNWWEMEAAKGQLPVPEWVKKGSLFQIENALHPVCLDWIKPPLRITVGQTPTPEVDLVSYFMGLVGEEGPGIRQTLEVEKPDFLKATLQVRGTYLNYASCIIQESKTLVLVPLQVIAAAGAHRRTVWSRLGEDLFEEDEDDAYCDRSI